MRKVLVLAAALALGTAAVAGNILPGFDHLKTQPSTVMDFPDDPTDPDYIGAGYFEPGSEPFEGQVAYVTDTKVWRSKPAEFSDPPVPMATVETEIVALSLHSVEPIEVTNSSGAPPRLFDVFITLDPAAGPSTGEYILEHNAAGLPDGGLMHIDSFFDVFYEIEFTPVDGGIGPLRPLSRSQRLTLVEPVPWSHTAPRNFARPDTGGFFPGFAETLPDDLYMPQTLVFQGSELTWHVRLEMIPEPATLALLALGAAALRRRRR